MYKIINQPKGLKFIDFYNNNDFHVVLTNYGASIYEIDAPNYRGQNEVVTLTPKSPYYFQNNKYLGLTVGRVAGRIENSTIYVDKKEFKLEPNENGNALHSSYKTLAYRYFDFNIKENDKETIVEYSIHVNDLEDYYPGNLDFKVIYTLSHTKNNIRIDYEALSDKTTYFNITNHSYFNLSGNLKDNILNHKLFINKEKYSEERNDQIFIKLNDVNEEFDFRKGMYIKEHIESEIVQKPCLGYDHMFSGSKPVVLSLLDEKSKRKLTITSDYKDVVIYTNNYETNTVYINDVPDSKYLGIAIEPSRLSLSMIKGGLSWPKGKKYKYYINYLFETIK